jgi:hypothetical protein
MNCVAKACREKKGGAETTSSDIGTMMANERRRIWRSSRRELLLVAGETLLLIDAMLKIFASK